MTGACPGRERIGPGDAALLPKLKSPNNQPALRTAPGASRLASARDRVRRQRPGRRHHRARRRVQRAEGRGAVPSDLVLDRVLMRGDRGEGPEARHRAQQRLDDDPEQLYRRHQGVRPGVAGDCRMERARPVHDREQFSRSRGGQHPVWRRRSGDSGSRCRPTSSFGGTSSRRTSTGAGRRGR